MTDEAAESRRPATTEGADPAQPPLPGEAPSMRPAHPASPQAAAAVPGADDDPGDRTDPDDQPTAEVPTAPAPDVAPPPVGTPAWVAEATTEPGNPGSGGTTPPGGTATPPPGGTATPPPGGTTPPPWGYDQPAGPPPPTGAGFTSRYGLVRPRQGRYLAGVCAAIGRATNTDPILWRVLLAVLGFFGGIGILVYLAAWLIIPSEGDTASPVESMLGRGRSSMSPVTVIILGVLVAVMFGFIVTDEFRAVLLGAAILIGGALLLNRGGAKPAGGMPAPAERGPSGPPMPAATWPGGPTAAGAAWPTGPTPPGAAWPAGPTPGTWPAAPTGPGGPPTVPNPTPADSVTAGGTYPAPPGAGVPAGGSPATPYLMTPGPSSGPPMPTTAPPSWTAAPPAMPTSAAPGGGFGPASSGGYRPAFAPYGPYAPGPYPPGAAPAPPKPPKPPKERSPLGAATFSMIFVAVGAVAVLDLISPVRIGPSAYFAGALVTIAVGLLVGAWFGRARWLIALGLAAATALGISTLAESTDRDRFSSGSVVWQPASYDVMAERYENTFGDATLDLRDVDFSNRDAQVTVQVNFGKLRVLVPPDVDVTALADVNAGDARVFDQRWSGFEGPAHEVKDLGHDGAGGGKLRLDLHVNAGDVEVTR